MPKTATKAKSTLKTATKPKSTKPRTTKTDKEQTSVQLNSYLQNEIARLAEMYGASTSVFEEFARFVIENYEKKEPIIKPPKLLTLAIVNKLRSRAISQ